MLSPRMATRATASPLGRGYQASAIGEGFADYFAAVMSEAHGSNSATTPAACLMDWDATGRTDDVPHCVRRVDTDRAWAGVPDGDPHADGEIWSAALWDLRQQIGRDQATQIAVEAQFWMTPSVTFRQAAQTTVATADLLYPGAGDAAHQAFASRGLLPGP